jgi:hypothetical protein
MTISPIIQRSFPWGETLDEFMLLLVVDRPDADSDRWLGVGERSDGKRAG